MRKIIGWVVRGSDRTHGELSGHAAAIQQLQEQHVAIVDHLRSITDDLAARVTTTTERLDVLEQRLDHLDEVVAELVRVTAPTPD